jgi:NTP pyrophosphatase (non-canonical NTP hydrolase)
MLGEGEMENEIFQQEANILDFLASSCAQISREHGFHDVEYDQHEAHTIAALALISSEVYEALEVYRKRLHKEGMTPEEQERFTEELADVVIRCFDLAGKSHLKFGESIIRKMEKNRYRPHLHGATF